MTGILCSMVGAKPAVASVTYPTGGIRFERANSERIAVSSWGNKPAENKVQVISYWFKLATLPSSAGTYWSIMAAQYPGDYNQAVGSWIDNSNRIQFYTHFGTGFNQTIYTPTTALTTGTWYHVVAKNNGTNSGRTQIWFNGTRVVDQAASNNGTNFGYAAVTQYGIAALIYNTSWWNDGCIEQLYWYAGDIDIDTNISKFYNNGYVNMGTAGTTSGLPTPHIYHYGNTQTDFATLRGSTTGTATVTGTLSACA